MSPEPSQSPAYEVGQTVAADTFPIESNVDSRLKI